MTDLTQMLAKLPPRRVFLAVLVLLGVVIAWFLAKEIGVHWRSAPRPAPGLAVKLTFAPWPAVSTLLSQNPRALPPSPFHSTHIETYLARVAAEKAAADAARKAAEEAARKAAEEAARKAAEEAARIAAQQAATNAASATPPPPPKFVDFLYRGALKRPDGEVLALIESGTPPEVGFYRAGDVCRGVTVTNIETRKVGLILKDGNCQILSVGEPSKIPEEQTGGK